MVLVVVILGVTGRLKVVPAATWPVNKSGRAHLGPSSARLAAQVNPPHAQKVTIPPSCPTSVGLCFILWRGAALEEMMVFPHLITNEAQKGRMTQDLEIFPSYV